MKYDHEKLADEITSFLKQNPEEYFSVKRLAKVLNLSEYILKKTLQNIQTDQVYEYKGQELIYIHRGYSEEKQIPVTYLDRLLAVGWEIGRCEKSKRSISIAEGGNPDAPKLVWIHRDSENLLIEETLLESYLNAGWQKNRCKRSLLGKIAIHKDDVDKYIDKADLDEYLADGWIEGGKPKKNSRSYDNVWNKGLTKYDDERIMRVSIAQSERAKNMPQETRDKISASVKKLHADPIQKQKYHQWKKGNIPWNKGLKGVITQSAESNTLRVKSFSETVIANYGSLEAFYSRRDELRREAVEGKEQEIEDKKLNTILTNFGDLDTYYRLKNEKAYITKKKNNSFNKSKLEECWYNYLCSLFPKEVIHRQYKDDRYPFNCDFYIESEDLFIEINGHWTHGNHPFDPNDAKDVEKLKMWEEKSSNHKFYKIAIYVWTELDVLKYKTAVDNKLNYRRYYYSDEIKL